MDKKTAGRNRKIIQTGIIEILINMLLTVFKITAGIISNSVAIISDGAKNMSSAMTSLVTILGITLSSKAPDKKHPFGYGRIEYVSNITISILILYTGTISLVKSLNRVFHPEVSDFYEFSIIVLAVSLLVKLLLSIYVKKQGKQLDSKALIISGGHSLSDSLVSAIILISALIYNCFNVNLEAYISVLIGILIIKSGIENLKEIISEILGERLDSSLARKIKQTISQVEYVEGAYDLVVHNYGHSLLIGSVHIEIPDWLTADTIDSLEREIGKKVFDSTGVIMTGISIYAVNTKDDYSHEIEEKVREIALAEHGVLQLHGFYLSTHDKEIKFDIIVSYDVKDREELSDVIKEKITDVLPEYKVSPTLDYDISD